MKLTRCTHVTFGIEIETTMPRGTCRVGTYTVGIQIPQLPEGWVAKSDSSIRAENHNRMTCEVVSPVLRGTDGIKQLLAVCEWLKSVDARVNDSCGLHVHVGWKYGKQATLRRLVNLVAKNEKAIYAATGTKKRERGTYAQPISRLREFGNVGSVNTLPWARHLLLNLSNLNGTTKRTVEFRAFAGTINPTKIMAYLGICLGLVQKARSDSEVASWDFATSQHPTSGAVALSGLLADLGWNGETPFGVLRRRGLEKMVAELNRLAAQYDAAA